MRAACSRVAFAFAAVPPPPPPFDPALYPSSTAVAAASPAVSTSVRPTAAAQYSGPASSATFRDRSVRLDTRLFGGGLVRRAAAFAFGSGGSAVSNATIDVAAR